MVVGIIEVVRKFSNGFDRTGDESHTGLETEVKRGISDTMFSEECLDIEDLGFEGFIGGGIKSKVHRLISFNVLHILYHKTPRNVLTNCKHFKSKRTQPCGQVL